MLHLSKLVYLGLYLGSGVPIPLVGGARHLHDVHADVRPAAAGRGSIAHMCARSSRPTCVRIIQCVSSMCACVCMCIYIYIYTYTHAYIHMYIYIYMHTYICTCVYIYIYIYTYIHIRIRIHIHVCVYIYIYIHTYTERERERGREMHAHITVGYVCMHVNRTGINARYMLVFKVLTVLLFIALS